MLNANAHKKFTASGEKEAEMLLERVLTDIGRTLSGTGLCVCLGGSYGRGDGGVRLDQENGILYNDLDFFVFARKKSSDAEKMLKEIAVRYEEELKIDVDFSSIMCVKDIKNNASRLMMQELKRGYHLVCGEDLLEKYLPEKPAEELPFSEACRLMVNRGMGLLLAGEKIVNDSEDTDFIMRNIYKAILGAVDAVLIRQGEYCWSLTERLNIVKASDMPEIWKEFYCEAVEFKRSPHRNKKPDMLGFWQNVREFFHSAMVRCAGATKENDFKDGIYICCSRSRERSIVNYMKYCIKTRTLPLIPPGYHTIPPVAVLAGDVFSALSRNIPQAVDKQSKLYRHWLMFN